MSAKIKITLNDREVEVESGRTILEACREQGIDIPVMCHFDGLSDVGACRLCLVEVEGYNRLLPSCTTAVMPNGHIRTHTEKLAKYRRMITELFFSERNHICSVCVANGACELQDMAVKVGMDHVPFSYLNQHCEVDASHPSYLFDHNRCIMCTRCVRVCDEVEGAHNWDIKNRNYQTRIISGLDEPWGDSPECTSCGKCVEICPTGALWPKGFSQGQLRKDPGFVTDLVEKRKLGSST